MYDEAYSAMSSAQRSGFSDWKVHYFDGALTSQDHHLNPACPQELQLIGGFECRVGGGAIHFRLSGFALLGWHDVMRA